MTTPSALLLLGLQQAALEGEHAVPNAAELSANLNALALRARAQGAWLVYVQHDEVPGVDEPLTRGWLLHPDFRAESGELQLRASAPNAFEGTNLDPELRALKVTRLTVAGLPSGSVAATARRAAELGYHVTVAEDGHAGGAPGEAARTNATVAKVALLRPTARLFAEEPS